MLLLEGSYLTANTEALCQEVHELIVKLINLGPKLSQALCCGMLASDYQQTEDVKERTKAYSLLSIALGLLLIWIAPLEWLIIPGCLLVGLGYGVIQPMLYEKTTHAALPQKATMALAFVMMMNYLAILLYPFIGDFLQWVFHTQSQEFPFIFNLLITVGTFFWAYRCRDTFLFNDQLK